jgi:XTP/dITP diphosphohydrolase
LQVDALDGAPGVFSARYAGEGATDADRYRKLLDTLTAVPWDRRTARFRCTVALATPAGDVRTAEGVCEGVIAFGPAGDHGFGYDPVFYMPDHNLTMAQLPPDLKNQVSHRARASQKALSLLQGMLSSR